MEILSIDVHLLELPLTEPFVASHGTTTTRTISALRLTTDVGIGWGECSALPAATYTAESAVGSFKRLSEQIAPKLFGTEVTAGSIGNALAIHADYPMAVSCVEMAALDAELSASGTSLAAWLATSDGRQGSKPAVASSIPAGVSIGLASIEETVDKCAALAKDGYKRLKVKIEPGHDLELVRGIRAALPEIELHVDANGAYRGSVEEVLKVISAGVDVVEQPFGAKDMAAATGLITALDDLGLPIPVVADEAVERHGDAELLLEHGAMTGLSIKPGRVGGFANARALHDLCLSNGIAATAGGMLETGLGRHALVALATLPGFTLTGDLSPAARWLAADPWSDLVMTDGRLTVPTGPGVAPEPDPELLERFTTEQITVS